MNKISSIEQLNHKFKVALGWNSVLFFVTKLSYLGSSTGFYALLDSQAFAQWAYVNSLVYLILLWSDTGLRKSIPLYIEEVSSSRTLFNKVLGLQLGAGLTGFFILWCLLRLYVPAHLVYCGLLLYSLEVPLACLRLLFHSTFEHKAFNRTSSLLILGEMSAIAMAYWAYGADWLVESYYVFSCIGMATLIVYCLVTLRRNHADHSEGTHGNEQQFIHHTGVMWVTGVLKSSAERNVLVPVLMFLVGPQAASLYKIINDWAIVIQRGIIKTIGTADTSYLAYMQRLDKSGNDFVGVETLLSYLWSLTLPFVGIVLLAVSYGYLFMELSVSSLTLFGILVSSYLLEVMLSPYERVLEIRRNYWHLSLTHAPFLLFIAGMVALPNWYAHLGTLVAFSVFVRVVSALTTLLIATHLYHLPIPGYSLARNLIGKIVPLGE